MKRGDHKTASRARKGFRIIGFALALSLLVPAGNAIAGRGSEIRRVVVIHLDTTRADDLSCNGGIPKTPNIDAVAACGMRYTNSIAPTPMTSPSIASFMTGRLSNRHGVYAAGGRLLEQFTTLVEILHDNGFVTGGFTSNIIVDKLLTRSKRSAGFDQGFDVFKAIYEVPKPPDGIEANAVPRAHAPPLVAQALRFIDQNRNQKFFLWMLHLDPHAPYAPPAPYDTMYLDHPELISSNVRLHPTVIHHQAYVSARLDSRQYIARHMGAVTLTDRWIGLLLRKINQLPGKTLLLITSDHGESLGDIGYWFAHGANIRHPGVNVPLIIACDGVVPIGVSDALVANIDLAPTILDIVGLSSAPLKANGLSLVSTFSEKDPWPDRAIPIQVYDGGRWRGVRAGHFCLQSQFYAYSGERSRALLYDLRNDPREAIDVSIGFPEVLRTLLQVEDEWFGQQRFLVRDLRDDPEMIRRLKSLGYLR